MRALRYDLLRAHWELAESKNQRKCRRTRIQPDVALCERGGRHHFDGVVRCGSATACPVCACTIAQRRSEELSRAFRAAQGRGWWYCMVTVTLRHQDGQSLRWLMRALSGGWRFARQGSGWTGGKRQVGWKNRIGYQGMVRALEATHGEHGWHPHFHVGLWLDRRPSQEELEELRLYLFGKFAIFVERQGLERPDERIAIRIDSDDNNQDPGWYIAKLGLAPELGSGVTKEGREGHRTPWQVLHDWTKQGRERDRALWLEWVEATRGHPALRWSAGIRGELLPGDVEQTDEELVQGEVGEEGEVLRIPGEDWDRIAHRRGVLASILEAADTGGQQAAQWRIGEALAVVIGREERGAGDIGAAEIAREAAAERAQLQREQTAISIGLAIRAGNHRRSLEECEDRAQGMVVPRLNTERVPEATSGRVRYVAAVLRRRREDELWEMILNSEPAPPAGIAAP